MTQTEINSIKVETTSAKRALDPIKELYRFCGYGGPVELDDDVVLAWHGDVLVGVVRLVTEGAYNLLRGMYIHPAYFRRGIGSQILAAFDRLAEERPLNEIFLTCGAHLEGFYGQIGFKKLDSEVHAPLFLAVRKAGYEKKYGPQLIMRRNKLEPRR